MVKILFIVGTGGFLGTISRYLVSRYIQQVFLSSFPYGTFIVNILGCLLIGFFFGLVEKGSLLSAEMRMFLTAISGRGNGYTPWASCLPPPPRGVPIKPVHADNMGVEDHIINEALDIQFIFHLGIIGINRHIVVGDKVV